MKLEYLAQIDQTLSKCGRRVLPNGVSAVPIGKIFVLPMVLQAGQAITFTKEITGNAPWVLRSITSDQTSNQLTGVRCQIQLPNGRFLFGGNGIDIGQFAWAGSWRWLQDPELRCEPGSKIQVTLSDTTPGGLSSPVAVNLGFEGAYLYFMRGGVVVPAPQYTAADIPRYQGVVNENILAPAWMSDEGLFTPHGYIDEYFVYNTQDPVDAPLQTTWTVTAGAVATQPSPLPYEIQIDPGFDFYCRRLLFDLQITTTSFPATLSTAIMLGKLRTGAGYVLNDSFIDLQRYLCGAEFGVNWRIRGGDSVLIDLSVADIAASAAGTITYQVFLEGFRRRLA